MSPEQNTINEPEAAKCTTLAASMDILTKHITRALEDLDVDSVSDMLDMILDANGVFVMGTGRSGLVGRAFATRLMHLGLRVYVVGESTTPALRKGDVVVAISGSGETMSIVDLGKVIKEIGAALVVVTSNPESSLGRMSDITVKIFGRSKDGGGDYLARHLLGQYAKLSELAPLGTTFEISALVFLDAAIAELMTRMGKQSTDLEEMHDKLQ
ncbi:MAG: 6-phospho-3-hexuloisomerase [Methanosarcinales archaeon]|nr:6-phospho-3-hexuloisomerase [Methanosarcinales archaeon]MCK4652578.1 6-phospho-3-hexuloisomerase [Methanosarcinales archaeon]